MELSRRRFLEACAMASGSIWLGSGAPGCAFAPVNVANPLGEYPDRGWEKVYLDQYHYDSTFTWLCAPNDTHMCRLRAFVRNGVMLRSEQNYDHDRCGDLYGNHATKAWNPRGCPKGYTMQRRIYGPYRLKGPLTLSSGAWSVDFDGKRDDGTPLSGGIYLVEVISQRSGQTDVRVERQLAVAPEGQGRPDSFLAAPNPARSGPLWLAWQPAMELQIRVYSINGELVRDLGLCSGGRAHWDLANGNGTQASGGIYLIQAGKPGERLSNVVKVAVVR